MQCPICLSPQVEKVSDIKNNSLRHFQNVQDGGGQNFSGSIFSDRLLYCCTNCTFSFSLPYLSRSDLNDFYSGPKWHGTRFSRMKVEASKKFSLNLHVLQRVFNVMQHVDTKQDFVFLDFGGSDGVVVEHIQELFRHADAYVCDSECYGELWSKRKINHKDLDQFKDESIDIFYSAHCFEHFNAGDLLDLIDLVYKKLKPGGFLYIEVPNEDIYGHKSSISYIGGPHLSHWNKKSLAKFIGSKFDLVSLYVRGCENRYGLIEKDLNYDLKDAPSFNILIRLFNRIHKALNKLGNDNSKQFISDYGYFNHGENGDLLVCIAKK